MRMLLVIVMVSSFFGLAILDLVSKNWRTGLASLLLGIVQFLIFRRPIK